MRITQGLVLLMIGGFAALVITYAFHGSTGPDHTEMAASVVTLPPAEHRPLRVDVNRGDVAVLPLTFPAGRVVPFDDERFAVFDFASDEWLIGVTSGDVIRRLDSAAKDSAPSVSPNGQLVAFFDTDTLRVIDLKSNDVVLTMPRAARQPDSLVWSADGRKLAVLAKAGDGTLKLEMVDIRTTDVSVLATWAGGEQVSITGWFDPDGLRVRTWAPDACCSIGASTSYRLLESGIPIVMGAPQPDWYSCGPPCGVPSRTYETSSRVIRWCASAHGGECQAGAGIIEQSGMSIRQVMNGQDFIEAALSPDGRFVAISGRSDIRDLYLRIVDVADLTSYDISLPYEDVTLAGC